ncbi:Lar family restriction alleviation protein [Sphingopyxis sp. 550A]
MKDEAPMTNDQTVTQALEPCPFCGAGDANPNGICSYSKGHEAWWADGTEIRESFFVNCVKCGISNRGMFGHQTRELAITAWNTRTAHSGEGRSNDDSPVALLHENAAEGEMEVELYRHGAACLTDADMAAGWTETPLYAHPPCEGRSNGEGEDAVEGGEYLIRKNGYWYRPHAQGYTLCKDDAGRFTLDEAIKHSHPNGPTGPRDGITYEPAPRRAALSAPQGEVERLREALVEHFPTGIRGLYEQSAQRIPVQTHVGTNCLCGWCTSATDEQEVREEWAAHVAAALAQPEAGGE